MIVNAPAAGDLARRAAASSRWRGAIEVWRERMRAHADAAYVHLIVNERREAGASLPHTHAQLYALDFVPAAIARERERFGAYATRTMGGNLLADLVQEEVRRRERIVAIDDEAVLMAPYGAARALPADARAARRRGRASRTTARPARALLHDALRRLARRLGRQPAAEPVGADRARAAPSTSAGGSTSCPRLTHLAGLELGRRRQPEHRRARAGRRRAARRVSRCERWSSG